MTAPRLFAQHVGAYIRVAAAPRCMYIINLLKGKVDTSRPWAVRDVRSGESKDRTGVHYISELSGHPIRIALRSYPLVYLLCRRSDRSNAGRWLREVPNKLRHEPEQDARCAR